jgi:hypothetical protein
MRKEPDIVTGEEERYVLLSTHDSLADLISKRLWMEARGIAVVNRPLGGESAVEDMRRFWGYAREGFRWQLRTDRIKETAGIDSKRFWQATLPSYAKRKQLPKHDLSIFEKAFGGDTSSISDDSEENKVRDPRDIPAYYLYTHIHTTLGKLHNLRVVTLEGSTDEEVRSLRELATEPTYWTEDLGPDTVWNYLHTLELGAMHAIMSRGSVTEYSEVMRAAHFFAIGGKIAHRSLAS